MTVEMPARVRRLDLDKHGRVVPWFVYRDENGVPDHRVVRAGAVRDALRFKKCWVCGDAMPAKWGTFLIGPMCAVNRISSEPPMHPECATYAARVCPFLTTPNMVRRETGLPDKTDPAGYMVKRNPGVTLIWTSRTWSHWEVNEKNAGPGAQRGTLFEIGIPETVAWYAEGREATRDEVLASLDGGLGTLMEAAQNEGPESEFALGERFAQALTLVPA